MGVYKRSGSPFWQYRFFINGKEFRGTTKRKSKREAEAVEQEEYRKVLDVRQFSDKPETTLGEALRRRVDETRMTGSGATVKQYEHFRKRLLGIEPFNRPGVFHLDASMPIHRLTQADLDQLRSERIGEGLRPNTVNGELRVLQSALNLASERYLTNRDLRFTKLKAFVRRRYVTEEQELQIIDTLTAEDVVSLTSYQKALSFYLFLVDTGLRLNEGLQMRWADINLSKGVMETYRQKTDDMSLVPLSDRVILDLRRRHNDPAPFEGMSYALKVLRRTLDEVCNTDARENDRLGKVTIHSLRDTYVTRLQTKGMSLTQIGKIVGHNSIDTTKKYAHLRSSDVLEDARAILNARRA